MSKTRRISVVRQGYDSNVPVSDQVISSKLYTSASIVGVEGIGLTIHIAQPKVWLVKITVENSHIRFITFQFEIPSDSEITDEWGDIKFINYAVIMSSYRGYHQYHHYQYTPFGVTVREMSSVLLIPSLSSSFFQRLGRPWFLDTIVVQSMGNTS